MYEHLQHYISVCIYQNLERLQVTVSPSSRLVNSWPGRLGIYSESCTTDLKKFAMDFLSEYPEYTIYPVRLNGSAVETFFSQMKHATSSQLSGVNYSSAKGTLLTRGSLHGRKKGRKGYRSAALFIRQHPLKRLNYGKK